MKLVPTLIGLLIGMSSLSAQELLKGTWQTGKDNTTIEITYSNDEWIGRIASSDNAKATLGKLMIKNLRQEKKGYSGQLYVIRYDRWVYAHFEPKENSLTVTVSSGMRSKTVNWTKEN